MKVVPTLARLLAATAIATVGACNCDTEFGARTYACATQDDCATGYRCLDGVCALDDGGMPATDAGFDAGANDSGQPDAGNDSGMPDSGSFDSGTGDSGTGDSGFIDSGTIDAGPDRCGPTASTMSGDAGLALVYCALHRSITIDADLTDWNGVPFTPLTKLTAELVKGAGTWSADAAVNDADISGLFALQWDDDNLYIAGKMTDDVRAIHPASSAYYQDDCFQVYLDGDHDRAGPYNADDYDLLIRADNAAQQFILSSGVNIMGLDRGMASATRDTAAGAAGWNVEMKIPWALLGNSAVRNGRVIGFDLIIDDDDNLASQVRKHYLIWQQNIDGGSCNEPYCSTASLGDALLVGAAQ